MPVDFGIVQRYNPERGFGFVSRTLHNSKHSTTEVFLHIKTVKRKYFEFAQELDNGSYNDVGFWYEVEKTSKGEQVSKLWLSVKDVPSKELDDIVVQVEGLWRDVDVSTPDWLDQVTITLVGQIRRNELDRERLQCKQREAAEQKRKEWEAECLKQSEVLQARARQASEQEAERRAQIKAAQGAKRVMAEQQHQACPFEIQKICEEYKIERLVHFTHIHNLYSVLQQGLLGRAQLEKMLWEEKPHYNDAFRLEGQPEAICLSISFPNYKMFYKYSCCNPSDWVVLFLKPSILWEMGCKFYRENAAARRQPSELKQMFEDYGHIQRQDLDIPDIFTTNPQAEVLVSDPIPPQYINEVRFYNLDSRQNWIQSHPGDYLQQLMAEPENKYHKYYFSPRQDYQMWNANYG